MYERLEVREILATTERLQRRIGERFPNASLGKVAARLVAIAEESQQEVERLRRPANRLRAGVAALLLTGVVVPVLLVRHLRISWQIGNISDLMQAIEATLGTLFFLGTGVFFLVRLEERLKRARTLRQLHKLRSVAHVVDMHQLTKDPEAILTGLPPTASSPVRKLSEVELRRYLDYSCELLALVGKVAALYAECLADSVVLDAVDDLEDLTAGLINKIWQKLVVMGRQGASPSAT
jgi:hypothetical protein